MCLVGDRLRRYSLVDEAGEFVHYVSLDVVEKLLEVPLVSLGELLGVAVDLLSEGFGLLVEVAFDALQFLV